MNDREKYTYQWPDNLVKEILPHDQFMQWILKPPKNCVALFHYMVCVSLRPFEADIVCRRYRDGQTLQKIGKDYSVSREWVRVVIQKCIEKLKNHQKRETLLNGLDWRITEEKKKAYQEGFRRGYRDSMGLSIDAVHNAYTMEHYLSGLPGYVSNLCELDLCERTISALKRVGISTIDQLIRFNEAELYYSCRLSKRAREEIILKLSRVGLHLREENKNELPGSKELQPEEWWVYLVAERLFSPSENDSLRKKIPVDFYETFLYVLETELTEVERNVFLAHYRDLKSVDTMVSELGLTRMQTTEYIGTTLHKLRKEPINSMLLLGIKGKINSLLRVESERGYFDGFDAGVNNREQSNVAGSAESVEKSLTVSIERIPIEELQLSMRARHCLQRAGIVTIGDLMQYSDKELLEIRYLGYTILNEIRDKQREHYSKLRTDVEISLMGDTVDDPA